MLYKENHLPRTMEVTKPPLKKGRWFMANKANDLAHTKWVCKYHIVFTPKYRRKIIYNQYKQDLRDILKQLCSYKGVQILEGHLMPDHIHMLVSIPPKMSVSSFMGYLKGKSALLVGRILCQYSGIKWSDNTEIYPRPGEIRYRAGQTQRKRIWRPF